MRTGKTGHVYAIGSLDLSDDTVGLDGSCESSDKGEGVTHVDWCC